MLLLKSRTYWSWYEKLETVIYCTKLSRLSYVNSPEYFCFVQVPCSKTPYTSFLIYLDVSLPSWTHSLTREISPSSELLMKLSCHHLYLIIYKIVILCCNHHEGWTVSYFLIKPSDWTFYLLIVKNIYNGVSLQFSQISNIFSFGITITSRAEYHHLLFSTDEKLNQFVITFDQSEACIIGVFWSEEPRIDRPERERER